MLETKDTIRLITLNTWKGSGAYRCRIRHMARELEKLSPNILCLQEVVRSGDFKVDTAGVLADRLNMTRLFAPARWKNRKIEGVDVTCHSGLAILTDLRLKQHWIDKLPSTEEDADRIALSAHLQYSSHQLTITNLHLTHLPDADDLRMEQLTSVLKQNHFHSNSAIWVCCGDFNFPMQQHRLKLLEAETGLRPNDCYLAGNGSLPGGTLAAADSPACRIDYILDIQRPETHSILTMNSKVVLDAPDVNGVYPSDHFGVCVDIDLNGLQEE